MIISRNKKILVIIALVALAGNRGGAEDSVAVLSPVKRQDVLEKAKKLLTIRDVSPVTIDPFHSIAFSEMISGPKVNPAAAAVLGVSPRSEHELLRAIAAGLKPSGNFVLSGQPTLVFSQKRVKAGGLLTITFEGTEYTLEITAIERTSFTLRLNREEFTRPIK